MHVSVIGLGRVGLPLALCFADAGLSVLGVDKDADQLDAVRSGRMPFKEPGADALLARVPLALSAHAADAAQADAIVLTLGTPSFVPTPLASTAAAPSSARSSAPSWARNMAASPPAMIPWTTSGSVRNVGGHSAASSTPSRPLVPAPT